MPHATQLQADARSRIENIVSRLQPASRSEVRNKRLIPRGISLDRFSARRPAFIRDGRTLSVGEIRARNFRLPGRVGFQTFRSRGSVGNQRNRSFRQNSLLGRS